LREIGVRIGEVLGEFTCVCVVGEEVATLKIAVVKAVDVVGRRLRLVGLA